MVLLKVKGRSGAAWRQGDLFNWRGTLRRAQGIRVARRQRRVKREGAEARRKSEGEEGISFSNGGARFVVTRGTGVAKRRRRVSRGGWRAGWLGLPARSRHWVNLKGGARKTEFFTRRRGGRGEDEEWIWRLDVRFLIIGGARFVVTWGRASRNGDGGFHAETRRARRRRGMGLFSNGGARFVVTWGWVMHEDAGGLNAEARRRGGRAMGGGGGSGFQPAVVFRAIGRRISEVGSREVSRGGVEIAEDGRRSEVSRNCPLNFASLRENLRRCSASRVPWSRRSVPLQFADGTSGVVARGASLGQDGACPSSLRSGPPVPLRNARPRVTTERAPPVFGVNFCLPPYFPPCLT